MVERPTHVESVVKGTLTLFFVRGPPLNKKSAKPDPDTGAINNIGEIRYAWFGSLCGTSVAHVSVY